MDARAFDAFCPVCAEPQPHTVVDAGSCRCAVCGHVALLMRPLGPA